MLPAATLATSSVKVNTIYMRISGITIPNKRAPYALTALYGIGISRAHAILKAAKVDISKKADEFTADEEAAIRKQLETIKLEGDLKRDVAQNIKRLKDIGTYRGSRHAKRLPARGQRTKTNLSLIHI